MKEVKALDCFGFFQDMTGVELLLRSKKPFQAGVGRSAVNHQSPRHNCCLARPCSRNNAIRF